MKSKGGIDMRKFFIMMIILVFYVAGMIQATYDIGIWLSVVLGLFASAFAVFIDKRIN